ncbi:DUF1643 domain-containing protein [Flagellimonas allohymeniacidonis]|uniref:DUF1643 domain-containing protein n=1 Tax=Flagellimonas allohymeniacidonis TaxID=2517819 RepID=A0A4Q8QGV7_9FLAO|nr:DUF1643 domain-containing protein [Allomuricauda hymeniacidonis]TAI49154.1 DUF1643 domain-containing protein [Allomuricauda hymeniacidonis]
MESKWIYRNNSDNTARFLLGEPGKNTLACIGLNPSTAQPELLDNTLKSVKRIAFSNGFDGWLMFNLYPQRATNPNKLTKVAKRTLISKNCEIFRLTIHQFEIKTLWLAFGNLVESRTYLPKCLIEMYAAVHTSGLQWKKAQSLTHKGHPRHPLYIPSSSILTDFDMAAYIKAIAV